VKELWHHFPKEIWSKEFLLKLLPFNDDGEEPRVMWVDKCFVSKFEEDPPKEEIIPLQQTLIPQMEQFDISLPKFSGPMAIMSYKGDPKFLRLYGNVNLDEPMITLEEVNRQEEERRKEWRER
jgi:hypothetical protein